jgi:hypothetical protein
VVDRISVPSSTETSVVGIGINFLFSSTQQSQQGQRNKSKIIEIDFD